MSTLADKNPTLLDVAKRMDPDGSVSAIAEMLSQENEILIDMPWLEGNLPTGHRTTVRTGLPEVYWRKLNQGVQSSKSTTAQIDEGVGMLEAFSAVDKDLAELNGNVSAFRLSESKAFIEAMNQTMATSLFYGDSTLNPERFMGLGPRFSDISGPENAQNIIDASGNDTDLTSIWLVGWGENSVHGIYPKGSRAGLLHEDLGIDTVQDAEGGKYRAYQDRYQWKCGMVVRDWRYVVRIANIDVSSLDNGASAVPDPDLIDLMTRALERIQSLQGVRPVFYVNRTVRSFLRRQITNRVLNSTLTMDRVAGVPTLAFSEVPVRRVDAILNNESRVV